MTFDEILSQVQDLLQREKRVAYRGSSVASASMTNISKTSKQI